MIPKKLIPMFGCAFSSAILLSACGSSTSTADTAGSAGYVIELDPQYNVPTEELLKLFPITYQTPAETEMGKKGTESYA